MEFMLMMEEVVRQSLLYVCIGAGILILVNTWKAASDDVDTAKDERRKNK